MYSTSTPSRDPDPNDDPNSHTRHGANSKEAYFSFRLGTRRVAALGKPCSHHPNVVFLRVLPGMLDWLFDRLLRLLPVAWRERLAVWLPEWFLPGHIIMKREKPGWVEDFDAERDLYTILAPLQGRVVPKLYGQIECPGTDGVRRRALIMSDIGGIPLGEPEVGSLPLDRVEEMLKDAFQALADAGVGQGDPKLDNIHVVGDKIMLIDFDKAYRIEDGDTVVPVVGAVDFSLRMYKNFHERWPPRPPPRPNRYNGSIWDFGKG